MGRGKKISTINTKVYLVGSGISSLASAVYLIKDANIKPNNIFILEQSDISGGACDGAGDEENGFCDSWWKNARRAL